MRSSPKEIERLLRIAIDLRAAGGNWNAVGEKTRRSAETCRRWPTRFRQLWDRLYAEAMTNRTEEARSEAVATLRRQLRSEDEKLRNTAARALLSHADRSDPAPQSSSESDFDCVANSISESEAQALADEYGSSDDA